MLKSLRRALGAALDAFASSLKSSLDGPGVVDGAWRSAHVDGRCTVCRETIRTRERSWIRHEWQGPIPVLLCDRCKSRTAPERRPS
jgi:hypothetical protein